MKRNPYNGLWNIKNKFLSYESDTSLTESQQLKNNGGEHFFDKSRQNIFPEADFYMYIKYDEFPFVIIIEKDEGSNILKNS